MSDGTPSFHDKCPNHSSAYLKFMDVSQESTLLYGVRHVAYCPLVECDYVGFASNSTKPQDRLLFMVALRQKVFFRKFAEQFVGDGK